jgi:hypothetical protein
MCKILTGSGQGPDEASCEHGNKSSYSIRGFQYLDRMSDSF